MTFFDQIVDQLFPKKSTANEILVHEPIKRSESYQESYDRWSRSFERLELLKAIESSYTMKQQGFIGKSDVHLLNTPSSNGFAVSYSSSIGKEAFQFLFDWLGEKVKELDYKRANADTTITAKGDQVESVSKYYFKPKVNLSNPEQRLDQQFGNILVEHILVDDNPSYIRLVANNYNDSKYKKADQFEKLAEFLFNK